MKKRLGQWVKSRTNGWGFYFRKKVLREQALVKFKIDFLSYEAVRAKFLSLHLFLSLIELVDFRIR